MDINKIVKIFFLGSAVIFYSCSETGNEPNRSTNTHNTSEPSPSAHAVDIPIDERSVMPASRLNDGNDHTGLGAESIIHDYAAETEGGETEGVEGGGGERIETDDAVGGEEEVQGQREGSN